MKKSLILLIGASFVILYLTSLGYTYVYYDEVRFELDDMVGGLFEMSAVIMFRGMLNVVLSIVYVPSSIIENLGIGLKNGLNILLDELGHIPDILRWIYNSWIVEIIRENIDWLMSQLGWALKPVYTVTIKIVIYVGVFMMLLSPIGLIYYLYDRYLPRLNHH